MKQPPNPAGVLVLVAGMALALVLGSVHAFSVFLEPLEHQFGAGRSAVSLTYSLALACLTVGVLVGHRVYARLPAPLLAVLVCLLGAAGCLVAAWGDSLALFWLGYGVVFGGANGLGYGFALQSAGQMNPKRTGLAMGLVTACYAVGAVIAPALFDVLLRAGGLAGAMLGLAAALVAIAPLVAGLLHRAKAELRVDRPADHPVDPNAQSPAPQAGLTLRLWLGYGTAVAAGLMAIGHATGIARAGGLGDALVLAAPMVIAAFNVAGSFFGGWLADRIALKTALMVFPAGSAVSLLVLARFDGGLGVLAALAVVGFAYGGTIAAYPAAVAYLFGDALGVRIYGRVFTAWGTAGLLAPWFAGVLFDRFGDYRIALATAGGLGLVSVLVVGWMDRYLRANAAARATPRKDRPHAAK
jgi:OFA family oxalate/formate antiporter-like MFS transporter